ncbi:uncharacterized protein B0T15DRAFT_538443 [Chaetomium strumarium]|uniref:Uncharacterized protein n=1 Tax=Chaetomium strumarium TaxID=1170767 RepID=A0AAJ0LYZ9_9PEZI|nr:hypothetical protein B0T15DRAFT_538443 [Chaetomium strumarium]
MDLPLFWFSTAMSCNSMPTLGRSLSSPALLGRGTLHRCIQRSTFCSHTRANTHPYQWRRLSPNLPPGNINITPIPPDTCFPLYRFAALPNKPAGSAAFSTLASSTLGGSASVFLTKGRRFLPAPLGAAAGGGAALAVGGAGFLLAVLAEGGADCRTGRL